MSHGPTPHASSVQSCLADKLSHYVELSREERQLLARFEEGERSYPRQTDLRQAGETDDKLYAVKKGWLYSYADFADGRRQIVKVHTPGDIVGFQDLAYDEATTSLRTCGPAVVCPFPKRYLTEVVRDAPRLAALLLTIALRDHVVLVDTLKATGRMSARERIAYFLCDMLARVRIIQGAEMTAIDIPLSQTEIGDVVGLTNVYVSKTLGRLEEAGRIRRDGSTVEILQEQELREMADYRDRYATLDTSWFPHS